MIIKCREAIDNINNLNWFTNTAQLYHSLNLLLPLAPSPTCPTVLLICEHLLSLWLQLQVRTIKLLFKEHHIVSLSSVVLSLRHPVQNYNILCFPFSDHSSYSTLFVSLSHLISLSPQARGESVGIASLLLSAGYVTMTLLLSPWMKIYNLPNKRQAHDLNVWMQSMSNWFVVSRL